MLTYLGIIIPCEDNFNLSNQNDIIIDDADCVSRGCVSLVFHLQTTRRRQLRPV